MSGQRFALLEDDELNVLAGLLRLARDSLEKQDVSSDTHHAWRVRVVRALQLEAVREQRRRGLDAGIRPYDIFKSVDGDRETWRNGILKPGNSS